MLPISNSHNIYLKIPCISAALYHVCIEPLFTSTFNISNAINISWLCFEVVIYRIISWSPSSSIYWGLTVLNSFAEGHRVGCGTMLNVVLGATGKRGLRRYVHAHANITIHSWREHLICYFSTDYSIDLLCVRVIYTYICLKFHLSVSFHFLLSSILLSSCRLSEL